MVARILVKAKHSAHIIPVLYQLYWLPVCFLVQSEVLPLTLKAINGLRSDYISDCPIPT